MLDNLTRKLSPMQKCLLYRIYVLPITLYGFHLQYFKEAPLYYSLKELKKMQRRAVLQITEVFCILPLQKVEATTGLIPIHLHLNKISGQHCLQIASLSKQHVINSLLDKHHSKKATPHYMSATHLMPKQHIKIKSSIMDTNNHLNKVFPSFNSLNKELSPGFQLIDIFSD